MMEEPPVVNINNNDDDDSRKINTNAYSVGRRTDNGETKRKGNGSN